MDGDAVDCYLGLDQDAETVYIVTTMAPPAFEREDEQKVMLGFGDEVSAVSAFLQHFDDPRFFGGVQAMPVAEFRRKVRAADGEMVKGGAGSGWHGPQHGGTHMPSSLDLDTLENARHYWRYHYGGSVRSLQVHLSGKQPIPIKVRFDESNEHAFTSDAGGKEKTGERVFDEKRAKAMSRILSVIEHPKARARNYGADLMFEAPVNGEHYTVVLTWREAKKNYEFHSAHFKSIAEVRMLWSRQDRRKNEGPLQKGGPSSVFAGLLGSTEPGDSLRWLPPSLAGNGMHTTTIPNPDEESTHKSLPAGVAFTQEQHMEKIDLLKSHIDAYTRSDGTVVQAHEDGRAAANPINRHEWIKNNFSTDDFDLAHANAGSKGSEHYVSHRWHSAMADHAKSTGDAEGHKLHLAASQAHKNAFKASSSYKSGKMKNTDKVVCSMDAADQATRETWKHEIKKERAA